ncbi:MAG: CNNM domain-containing protein, partial [Candidatus Omnitrophota bacterium]
MTILLGIIIICIMLALNGILAAYEMALVSVSRARLHVLAGRHLKGAGEAGFMKDHMEASLAVIQLGLTLVSAIAAATGGLSASDQVAPWISAHWGLSPAVADVLALIFIVIPLSSMTIIFAELVPKMAALNDRERVCLMLSPFMKGLFVALSPVVRLFERVVKGLVSRIFRKPVHDDANAHVHELQAAAALARTSRLIGAREEKIVVAAAQLSTRKIREIMILREDICTIPADSSLQDALIRAHMDMHT